MRLTALATVVAMVAVANAAMAQSRDQRWEWCQDVSHPDVAIDGCTALIQSGRENAATLPGILYNRGTAYYGKGQLDLAIADYDQVIRLDPGNAVAYNNRGYARDRLGQTDDAIADYDHAVRLDAGYALAFNNRGYAFYKKGQVDRAIADYDEAIRLDPGYAAAFNNRCWARAVTRGAARGPGRLRRVIAAAAQRSKHARQSGLCAARAEPPGTGDRRL